MKPAEITTNGRARNGQVAAWCVATVAAMLGLAYASVPLYGLFCQVTGFGGTTQRADSASGRVLDRRITVRLDANVAPDLAWSFAPVESTVDLRIGETALVFYRARNMTDRPLTGSATFNVTPEIAGGYFNKIECFCFQEQRLEPGETIEMPVSFFIDPAIVEDRGARRLTQITLSYTFFPIEAKHAAARGPGGRAAAATGGGGT